MIPEYELVARAKNGDKAVFIILYKRYFSKIYSFIKCKFSLNREDVKDIAQEIMTKAYHNLYQLKDNSMFKSWLFRIAYNHGINHKKRKKESISKEEEQRLINPES